MPHARRHHGDAVFVGRGDHLVVTHRAAGLDDRGCAGLDGRRRAWCETEGHCTELWRERWHVYLTGHLPPMFSGGTDPAPTIEPFADPTPLPGVPPAATCHDGVVDLRDYMPPRDLLLPAAAVLVVGALSGVYMLARLALDLAGIEWDAADDL